MHVQDEEENRPQNPCSIIGCNSPKCAWASGGLVTKVMAKRGCANSKLLGREEVPKVEGNSTSTMVKVETLRDCMHAVRDMTDCGPFFEVHAETFECSCVPVGSDCDETDKEKVC